jgi:hypothetical protein
MPQPDNSRWWTDWHLTYGVDSQEEHAFQGYLYQHGIAAADASAETLEEQWTLFVDWWATSLASGEGEE